MNIKIAITVEELIEFYKTNKSFQAIVLDFNSNIKYKEFEEFIEAHYILEWEPKKFFNFVDSEFLPW